MNIAALHLAAAALSLLLGAAVLIRRKGTPFHKVLGRIWVALMLAVAVSSFWILGIGKGSFSYIPILGSPGRDSARWHQDVFSTSF
jgi:uncharacterized membrane protein